jgi:hypothetical protein
MRAHHQLCENASRAPNIDSFVVLPLTQQNLGRAVPPRYYVLREQVIALASGQAEVANMNIAIRSN